MRSAAFPNILSAEITLEHYWALGFASTVKFFQALRIIYRVMENVVYVFLIADGWRDMQALLQWRLLGA